MIEGVIMVLSALLGWLLGLLTPQIVDTIRRRYERGYIAEALTSELRELSERMTASAHYIWSRHGQLSMERLHWAASVLEAARYHPRHRRIARNLRNILAQGPEELRHLNVRNAANQVNRRISVRRIETPYLTSVLPRLDVFPAGTRQALLSIEAQFKLHNEVVDECREYGRMTFDASIVGENRESVLGNLRNAEAALAQRAHYIVTLIGNLDLDTEVPRTGEFLEDEPPLPEVQGARDEAWE